MQASRIVSTAENERCLVATREISPLEIVLHDQPAVVVPDHLQGEVCLGCLQELEDDDCVTCEVCGYNLCSQECGEGELHREECKVLARGERGAQVGYRVIGILRLLGARRGNRWKEIDSLLDHGENRRKNTELWERMQEEAVDVVKEMVAEDVDDEEIHRMIGIMDCNSFSFTSSRDGVMGRGLYPLLAMANHSCVANCRLTVNTEDFSVVLKAKRTIVEGEEITINYSHPIYGVPKRKIILSSKWFFTCKCPRCCDVTEFGTNVSALKCCHCREGLILPDTPDIDSLWHCRFCSNPFESAVICEILNKIEDELYNILEMNPTVKDLEGFIRKNSKDLHSKHFLNLIAQRNIINLLTRESNITREMARKVIKLGKFFKGTLAPLDSGYSEWLGFALKKINMAQLELLKIDLKEKKINKNAFAEESENIWKAMKDVEKCEELCKPLNT